MAKKCFFFFCSIFGSAARFGNVQNSELLHSLVGMHGLDFGCFLKEDECLEWDPHGDRHVQPHQH